ncbi:interleukin-1 receptor-associated kinase 1-binding protein 1 isoform X2 [Pezoporus flaviventris]|uniref:interleukin-1 receptor-associated kinase 1-binding protein 1 isoform X2 n=1 Tax=Pezoporus flaviventris TaxID=889875 RepID=UPI002AB24180|nr:interleukin-1 receptor-associated kinase 1-binding protein 1 isoform X2 [Pezoporus flaviventris]
MALSAPAPSRVFAELVPAQAPTPLTPAQAGRGGPSAPSGREVHVSGSAELSAGPDRARVSARLSSRKEAAGAARSSVTRRLEYIAQTARQRGVPVCIIFSDFGKMQNVCNLLIEKLGTSVTISPPHFYHTPEAVDTLRRQVCVAAVENTRRKAQEVCRLFGQSLGKPLLIREEETREWGGHTESHLPNSPDLLTLQERIQNATAYASCRVFAVFEIKGKENRRNKLL